MDFGKTFFQLLRTASGNNSLVVASFYQPETGAALVILLSMSVSPSKRRKTDGKYESVKSEEDGENGKESLDIEEDSQKDEEEEVTTYQLWRDFLHSLTLHGFRFIFEEGPKIRKCFWLIILLLAVVMLILQTKKSIQKYFERPITTSVQVEFLDQIIFPAVTICNFNLFPYYLINGTIGEKVSHPCPVSKAKEMSTFQIFVGIVLSWH